MNINPQYNNYDGSDFPDAVLEMKGCMEILKELLIDPMIKLGHIDEDDEEVINAVGFSLQYIATKAKHYDKFVKESFSSETDELNTYEDIFNYRN